MASSDSCARKSDRSAVRIRLGELFRRGKRRLGAMRIPKCELPRSIQLRWSTAKSRAFSVTTARRSAVATSRTFSSLSGRGHERSLIALTSWPSHEESLRYGGSAAHRAAASTTARRVLLTPLRGLGLLEELFIRTNPVIDLGSMVRVVSESDPHLGLWHAEHLSHVRRIPRRRMYG